MVNKKGGKKHKRGGKKNNFNDTKLILKTEDDMKYGKAITVLGNCRFTVLCEDGSELLGILRGSMRKRAWINKDSIILVSTREFERGKCDIIHVYSDSDTSQLKKIDGFPQELLKSEEETFNEEEEDYFNYDDISDDDEIDLSDI